MNRRVRFSLLTCLFVMICEFAKAEVVEEQKFFVANNGTVIAVASKKEITRIIFQSDVESVHSIAGELEYTVQGKDLYLRAIAEKPINFFVRTMQGQTYKFILDVRDIPAGQIFVNSNSSVKYNQTIQNKTILWDLNISEELRIKIQKVINVSLKSIKNVGYKITKDVKNISSPIEGINLKQLEEISGKGLFAKKLIVSNETDNPQIIAPKDFITENQLAVYMDKTVLKPKEKGILIIVSEEE